MERLRVAVAVTLAAVSLAVLTAAAALALLSPNGLSVSGEIAAAVFLGLLSYALAFLLGASPWPDVTRVLALALRLAGIPEPPQKPQRSRRTPSPRKPISPSR